MNAAEQFAVLYEQIAPRGHVLYPGTLLQRAAQLYGKKTALICNDASISYSELFERAWQLTQVLKEKGVGPTSSVCMLVENSITFYVVYYGIWQTGAVVIPLNVYLQHKELEHILADAQPALCIVSDSLWGKAEALPAAMKQRLIHEKDLLSDSWTTVDPDDAHIPAKGPDELAALLYTSGTTGLPKGVMLSSRNIMTNVAQGLACFRATTDEVALGVLPLFHSFAQLVCVWGSTFIGATVVVVPKIERRHILQAFKHRPTTVLGVPALYGLFALMKSLPLERVRYFVSGGDALPNKIRIAFALIYRRTICNGYGLTETSPVIAADMEDVLKPANCVGKPVPGLQIRILSDHQSQQPPEAPGVIWVKGDNVMLGYYHAPELTAEVVQDGWFNTGDLGYLDKLGRLVITGREKDLIIHKGFNIYPQEIEQVLSSHPAVLRAAAIGIADSDAGQIPIAYVQVEDKKPNIEKELAELCAQELAAYKCPRRFVIRQQLPLTSLGKIDKKALRTGRS